MATDISVTNLFISVACIIDFCMFPVFVYLFCIVLFPVMLMYPVLCMVVCVYCGFFCHAFPCLCYTSCFILIVCFLSCHVWLCFLFSHLC